VRYAGPISVVGIVVEIIAAVAVAHATSWGLTIIVLVALSLFGVELVRREIFAAVRGVRAGRGVSGDPEQLAGIQLADAAVRVGGALLVLVPGFVTAAAGLLLLFPPVRLAARRIVGPRWARRLHPVMSRRPGWPGGGSSAHPGSTFARGHDVIDGEVVDDPPPPHA
jgi:UPF0716 protein FxsA